MFYYINVSFQALKANIYNVCLAIKKNAYMSLKCHFITDKFLLSVYLTTNAHDCLDIYLQAEEAPIVSCSDSR